MQFVIQNENSEKSACSTTSFLVILKEKYKWIYFSAYNNTSDDIKQILE